MSEQKVDTSTIINNGLKAYEEKLQEKERQEKEKRKKWIVNYALFLIVTAIIVYIFPSTNQFKYAYALGEHWGYEALEAPIDFPILKTEDELKKDYNDLLKQYYTPYFHTDTEIINKIEERFTKGSKSNEARYGEDYTLYIKDAIKKVCDEGIISNKDNDDIERIGITKLKILVTPKDNKEDNYYVETDIKKIRTEKEAYNYIIENVPNNLERKIVKQFNINEYLRPTLVIDEEQSALSKKEATMSMSRDKGKIEYGRKIVERGEIITNETFQLLESLKYELENSQQDVSTQARAGQAICVLCILTALFLYFVLFRDFYLTKRRMIFILGMVVGMCALTAYVTNLSYNMKELTVYIIPYAIVPITISTFFDTRSALFSHLATVLICSLIAPHEFEFLLLQILIGMICISTLKKFYQRSQLFKTVGIIASIYIITYLGLVLTHAAGWDDNDTMVLISFLINAGLLLFSYPLIFVFEKLFNFTSDITLVELTNSNNPLLRQFSEVAPGSFQHSLQVSNLASDAADHIGCNALLARAGALYHDIGKMANAIYFTENQNGYNPHSKLTALESVKIITNHVSDGLIIARKNGLPQQIQKFIESHHGKNPVRYFYNTYCNEHPDEEVDIKEFSYKGQLPTSKEEAVVMICDTVEAASRSLDTYTDEKINNLIEGLVAVQLKDGAFADAPITLKEIEDVKTILKEKLKNLYHTRIRYPELNKKKD